MLSRQVSRTLCLCLETSHQALLLDLVTRKLPPHSGPKVRWGGRIPPQQELPPAPVPVVGDGLGDKCQTAQALGEPHQGHDIPGGRTGEHARIPG